MGLKNFLALTNPITIIAGIPILVGIILGVILHNVAKDTGRVVSEFKNDVM